MVPRRLYLITTPYLLRRLDTPYLLRGLATPYLLGGLATLYLLRRHYSLVITSRPEPKGPIRGAPLDSTEVTHLEVVGPEISGLGRSCVVSIKVCRVSFEGVGVVSSRVRFCPEVFGLSRSELVNSSKVVRVFDRKWFSSSGIGLFRPGLDVKLETLIATYDIPLDLRPRLPDPNFRMINIPARDMAIGIYSRIFDSLGVRIPFSSFLLAVLKYSKVHITQLVPLVMSIYDFLCMPSIDKVTVRKEPHELDTSILGRVVDCTTSPTPAPKQKASTRPEISTNVAKKTKSNKKGFGADVIYPPILLPNKEVEAHAKLSGGVRRATRAIFRASHGKLVSLFTFAAPTPDAQPLDADAGADEIASDGNVDLYYEARVDNTARDVLERDLLPIFLGPYYIPYPYDEGSGKLYKDPKVCRTDLDQFPTLAETHRLRELSSTQTIKRQSFGLKQQNESTIRANEEVSRLTDQLGVLKSRCQTVEQKLSSWDKKHKKYRNERDTLAMEKAKIKEELVRTKSQLEHLLESSMGCVWIVLMKSSGSYLRVVGFIPDAKKKFDRVVATFPDITFPLLDKTSSAMVSLRSNTHVRHSTSSSGTFGHTSTLEHLKKKKKPVEKARPSAI
nr:hypothetical protein [Tanacetum cinerariifolium]